MNFDHNKQSITSNNIMRISTKEAHFAQFDHPLKALPCIAPSKGPSLYVAFDAIIARNGSRQVKGIASNVAYGASNGPKIYSPANAFPTGCSYNTTPFIAYFIRFVS